jgi:hypothetical protein
MANRLRMALIETIITLRRRGWSRRRIARELDIDRETVTRHLRDAAGQSNATIAPTGSAPDETESNATIAPTGSQPPDNRVSAADSGAEDGPRSVGRPSDCAPFRALIVAGDEDGLSAQRIYQDLVAEHGFTGSYYSVRRLTARFEPPFHRMECEPGDECQVDFGRGVTVILTRSSDSGAQTRCTNIVSLC